MHWFLVFGISIGISVESECAAKMCLIEQSIPHTHTERKRDNEKCLVLGV